jgi:hypothetical protein
VRRNPRIRPAMSPIMRAEITDKPKTVPQRSPDKIPITAVYLVIVVSMVFVGSNKVYRDLLATIVSGRISDNISHQVLLRKG